jgi:hypothetical protein
MFLMSERSTQPSSSQFWLLEEEKEKEKTFFGQFHSQKPYIFLKISKTPFIQRFLKESLIFSTEFQFFAKILLKSHF